jgi:hypothetical protein
MKNEELLTYGDVDASAKVHRPLHHLVHFGRTGVLQTSIHLNISQLRLAYCRPKYVRGRTGILWSVDLHKPKNVTATTFYVARNDGKAT